LVDLMRSGALGRDAVNVAFSVLRCICAVALGHIIASRFNDGPQTVAQLQVEEDA
jgi:fluoride exporter